MMACLINSELEGMHKEYGAVKCNGRAVQGLYKHCYPRRRTPSHKLSKHLQQQLSEKGFFWRDVNERTQQNHDIEETV
ncbi:hypothetical protein NPIL_107481 [Nephila pilipes]|uniref:Uncharacterized protein n=1 Tax=Nephila pilipes TaxID=299642 RepID=A0A8X6PXH9_NEPPI|nr:hypothetical protein NPIL_107481 [Nephila pilipes]